jgi:hypothetical protein
MSQTSIADTGGNRNLSSSLSNVVRLAAHPKFVWVFNANCDGTITCITSCCFSHIFKKGEFDITKAEFKKTFMILLLHLIEFADYWDKSNVFKCCQKGPYLPQKRR